MITLHRNSDSERKPGKVQDQKTKQETRALKTELNDLLSQPLIAQGIIKKYITSGARNVASELLDAEGMFTCKKFSRAMGTNFFDLGSELYGFKQGEAKNEVPINGTKRGKVAKQRA